MMPIGSDSEEVSEEESEIDDEDLKDLQLTLAKKSIDRKDNSVLDLEKKFIYVEDTPPKMQSGAANKRLYMENYTVNFELPGLYVLDAKICKTKPSCSL